MWQGDTGISPSAQEVCWLGVERQGGGKLEGKTLAGERVGGLRLLGNSSSPRPQGPARESFKPLHQLLDYFLSAFFWFPLGTWSSQTRDQIQDTFVTYTTAVAMPDPLTCYARQGIEPASWCCRDNCPIPYTTAGTVFSLPEPQLPLYFQRVVPGALGSRDDSEYS